MSAHPGDYAIIIKSKCGNCGIIGKILKQHCSIRGRTHWMMEFERKVAITNDGERYRFMVVCDDDIVPVFAVNIQRNNEIAQEAYSLPRGIA